MGTTGRRKPNATVKANDDSGGKSGAGKRRKDAAAVDAASAAASDARAEVEGLAAGAAAPTESSEDDEDEEESDKEKERAAKGDKRGRRSNTGTPQGTPAKKKINARTELHEPADECEPRHSDRAEKLALIKENRELRAQLAGKNTVNIGCIHIFHVTDLTTLSAEHSNCQSEEAQIHWRCDQV